VLLQLALALQLRVPFFPAHRSHNVGNILQNLRKRETCIQTCLLAVNINADIKNIRRFRKMLTLCGTCLGVAKSRLRIRLATMLGGFL
jgi:hypothetical protein